MSDYEFIEYRTEDHIAYVTFNRPEVLNAMHQPMHAELSDVWQTFKRDDDLWVAIVTGAGDRAFSAGNDLKYTTSISLDRQLASGYGPGGFGGMTRDYDCHKPIIAAVNGYAMGGGFEIALACDLIVASDTAAFSLPEVRRGLFAGAGGIHRLRLKAPYNVAMSVMLTGRRISAHEAHQWGIVNEVVRPQDLMSAAKRWADLIAECSPVAVRLTKEAVRSGLQVDADTAIYNDRRFIFPRLIASADAQEGPRAFVEKRSPVWTGK